MAIQLSTRFCNYHEDTAMYIMFYAAFQNICFSQSLGVFFTGMVAVTASVGDYVHHHDAGVPRSALPCCSIADEVVRFSMTSRHEIFDSAASSGMLGHLGGGTPQSAQARQAFQTVLPLFSALKLILDPSTCFLQKCKRFLVIRRLCTCVQWHTSIWQIYVHII